MLSILFIIGSTFLYLPLIFPTEAIVELKPACNPINASLQIFHCWKRRNPSGYVQQSK